MSVGQRSFALSVFFTLLGMVEGRVFIAWLGVDHGIVAAAIVGTIVSTIITRWVFRDR